MLRIRVWLHTLRKRRGAIKEAHLRQVELLTSLEALLKGIDKRLRRLELNMDDIEARLKERP